jgi:hypothetical protein
MTTHHHHDMILVVDELILRARNNAASQGVLSLQLCSAHVITLLFLLSQDFNHYHIQISYNHHLLVAWMVG